MQRNIDNIFKKFVEISRNLRGLGDDANVSRQGFQFRNFLCVQSCHTVPAGPGKNAFDFRVINIAINDDEKSLIGQSLCDRLGTVHKTASSVDNFQVTPADFLGDFRPDAMGADGDYIAFYIIKGSRHTDAKSCKSL